MLWHEQTWQTIAAIDKEKPVVIPLGSLEQHGHHLPLFVDTIQVTSIAEGAEKELKDDVLLLPTLWLGASHHHIDFAGTVSVLPSLYGQMIQSVARCILGHGFRRLFFFNGHGGNDVPASNALTELTEIDERADDALIVLSAWWQVGKKSLDPAKLGMTTPGISHACEYETSLMLKLRPDLVKQNKAVDGTPTANHPMHAVPDVEFFKRFHRTTAAGNSGRPSAGTAEKGAAMFEVLVTEVVKFVREFAKWPHLPAVGPK